MSRRAGRMGGGRSIRRPSHARRASGLGHRTQGSAVRSVLRGLNSLLDPIHWRLGRWAEPAPSRVFRVPRPGLYVTALGLFAAAMLSKSVAITMPVAFAILFWWKNSRLTWTDAWRIAPFFLVALFIAVADLSYYTSGGEFGIDYVPVERVLIAARALWFYVGKLMADRPGGHLSVVGHRRRPACLGLRDRRRRGCGVLVGRHRLGRPLVGVIFFVVTLPVLGFVDFGYMMSLSATRTAGIGVAVLVGGVTARCEQAARFFKRRGISSSLFSRSSEN